MMLKQRGQYTTFVSAVQPSKKSAGDKARILEYTYDSVCVCARVWKVERCPVILKYRSCDHDSYRTLQSIPDASTASPVEDKTKKHPTSVFA